MNVTIHKMSLLVEGRDDVSIDLTKPEEEIKKEIIPIKEGCTYRLKLDFKVHREIVSGLKYHHTLSRKGVTTDKFAQMVGSYGPKEEVQSFTCLPQEAPKGMLARGTYVVKSMFSDDDKIIYAEWGWNLAVHKDW